MMQKGKQSHGLLALPAFLEEKTLEEIDESGKKASASSGTNKNGIKANIFFLFAL